MWYGFHLTIFFAHVLQFGLYYILSWWCLINRHCHNDPRPIFTKWKDVLLINVMKPRSRDIQFYNNRIALKPDRNLGSGAAEGHTSEKALKLFPQTLHRWLNAKRTYLQCVSIRFTFLLHLAVDVIKDGKGWNGRDLCMPLTLEFLVFYLYAFRQIQMMFLVPGERIFIRLVLIWI